MSFPIRSIHTNSICVPKTETGSSPLNESSSYCVLMYCEALVLSDPQFGNTMAPYDYGMLAK